MKVLKKIWAWLKSYWLVPLTIIGFVVAGVFFSRKDNDTAELLEKQRKIYKQKEEKIEKIEEEKIEKKKIEKETYEKTVAAIETEFQEKKEKLTRKKKKRVKKIIKETNNDTTELAKRISSEFGIRLRRIDV